ncbi:MAG: protein-arginine deiminase family protein [Nannocystaceae bacterium]
MQPHLELDATWLIVNHVDEIISFVPRASADPLRAFALLIASPRRAHRALWSAHQAGHGGATMLTGRHFGPAAAQLTVDEYLGQGGNLSAGLLGANLFLRASAVPPTAADYLQWNNTCQARLDAVLAALAAEIEIPQVIEIPMLFMPVDELPSGTQLFCAATPGSVNMLVLNGHCIIPDPFGPMLPAGDLFQACMRNELEALGLTVNFIDDWDYHSQVGDVHCATNTRRIPQQGRVAWWGYVP